MTSVAELIKQVNKEHKEQLHLLDYQSRRKLSRPKTTKLDVALAALIYLAALVLCVVLGAAVRAPFALELPISVLAYVTLTELALRNISIKAVECYQHYATEERRRKCLCVPSCSEYAIMCLTHYEAIWALVKIRKRLKVTCQGERFVIDPPYKGWELPPFLKRYEF